MVQKYNNYPNEADDDTMTITLSFLFRILGRWRSWCCNTNLKFAHTHYGSAPAPPPAPPPPWPRTSRPSLTASTALPNSHRRAGCASSGQGGEGGHGPDHSDRLHGRVWSSATRCPSGSCRRATGPAAPSRPAPGGCSRGARGGGCGEPQGVGQREDHQRPELQAAAPCRGTGPLTQQQKVRHAHRGHQQRARDDRHSGAPRSPA